MTKVKALAAVVSFRGAFKYEGDEFHVKDEELESLKDLVQVIEKPKAEKRQVETKELKTETDNKQG